MQGAAASAAAGVAAAAAAPAILLLLLLLPVNEVLDSPQEVGHCEALQQQRNQQQTCKQQHR